MLGLDTRQPSSLLPLGDRPVLQHIVELLVAQKITAIEVISGHAPERVEALLGNGERWGCSFRYHLAAEPERPYRSLNVIPKLEENPWLLIHAERCPCAQFEQPDSDFPLVYAGTSDMDVTAGAASAVVFPAGAWAGKVAGLTRSELDCGLHSLVEEGSAVRVQKENWIDASSPDALLRSQGKLLRRELNGLTVNGIERKPGIWVSRNVVIHPTAELSGPLYIGPDSRINRGVRLGPYSVIGGSCIIDANTSLEQSLVLPGSYVGEGLELNQTIIDRGSAVNVRLGARVDIREDFLLGGLTEDGASTLTGNAVQSVIALVHFLLFLPLLLLGIVGYGLFRRKLPATVKMASCPVSPLPERQEEYKLPCVGADGWSDLIPYGWRSFITQFLPGLVAVMSGKLYIVGLPPKSLSALERLTPEWAQLYKQLPAGLISEASVAIADEVDPMQEYLCAAYYAAKHSRRYDFSLYLRYMSGLLHLTRPHAAPGAKRAELLTQERSAFDRDSLFKCD